MSSLEVLAVALGAITGWEIVQALAGAPWRVVTTAARQLQWRLVYVLLFRRDTIESVAVTNDAEPVGWDHAQSRAIRLVRLQNVVRGALPADPQLDSPYQRELREAAFGEHNTGSGPK